MKVLCLLLAALMFFSACYSTPRVSSATKLEEGRYQINISRDYAAIPQEFKYAVNSFVMDLGEYSYDVETVRRGPLNDYYVLTPGSQDVENMQEVRHFHKGKTVAAIVIPVVSVGVVVGIVAYVAAMVALASSY